MKLVDLIDWLADSGRLEALVEKEGFEDRSMVEIYMIGSLSLESEIVFFDAEKTPPTIEFEENGIAYIEFFPLEHALDSISDLQLFGKGYSNDFIARRLFEYRINDA